MSAAALRYAAARRTIIGGGALQRSPKTIQGEARPRLIHSGKPLSYPRTASISNKKLQSLTSGEGKCGTIQKMKDELYSALAETERKNTIVDSLVSENQGLMEYLSVQVSPRPNDPQWRSYRRGKTINECFRIAGIIFITHMVADTLFGTEAPREGRLVDYTEIESELERDAITR